MNQGEHKLIERMLASNHKYYVGVAAFFYAMFFLLPEEPWVASFAGLGTATLLFLWYPNYVLRHKKQTEIKAED